MKHSQNDKEYNYEIEKCQVFFKFYLRIIKITMTILILTYSIRSQYLPEKSICQSHPTLGRYISLKMSHVARHGPESSKQTVIFTLTTYFFSSKNSLIEYLYKEMT